MIRWEREGEMRGRVSSSAAVAVLMLILAEPLEPEGAAVGSGVGEGVPGPTVTVGGGGVGVEAASGTMIWSPSLINCARLMWLRSPRSVAPLAARMASCTMLPRGRAYTPGALTAPVTWPRRGTGVGGGSSPTGRPGGRRATTSRTPATNRMRRRPKRKSLNRPNIAGDYSPGLAERQRRRGAWGIIARRSILCIPETRFHPRRSEPDAQRLQPGCHAPECPAAA